MSYVVNGSKIRETKNLGWILRNWKMVDYVSFHYCPMASIMVDGMVEFYLEDGRKFFTNYASFDVFLNWIDRPIYRGLPLWIASNGHIFGTLEIGSAEFRRFRYLRSHK